jgi:hypothetical protein
VFGLTGLRRHSSKKSGPRWNHIITAHGRDDEELIAFNYQNIVCLHLHLTKVPKS